MGSEFSVTPPLLSVSGPRKAAAPAAAICHTEEGRLPTERAQLTTGCAGLKAFGAGAPSLCEPRTQGGNVCAQSLHTPYSTLLNLPGREAKRCLQWVIGKQSVVHPDRGHYSALERQAVSHEGMEEPWKHIPKRKKPS